MASKELLWTYLGESDELENMRYRQIWVKCVCGLVKQIRKSTFKKESFGCSKCCQSRINKTHGQSHTKLYRVFKGMVSRCYNKNQYSYRHYGARGIKICDEWLRDRSKFLDWAKSGYKEGLTIERINNAGNYEPENCCWITRKQQAKNKRCRKPATRVKHVNKTSYRRYLTKENESVKSRKQQEDCIG